MHKTTAIISASVAAAVAVAIAHVAVAIFLGQMLEDLRPSLVPLVNIGGIAILSAVAIITFRFVRRMLQGERRQ